MTLKQDIAELRAKGLTVKEIAEQLGRTEGSTTGLIRGYGLTKSTTGPSSYVLRKKTKGGVITLRIDSKLHKKLAKKCKVDDISINKFVTQLIQAAVDS